MARKREIEKYPKEYYKLFELASVGPVHVALESSAQAENLRNDLYGFRKVVYSIPEKQDFADLAANVRITIKGSMLIAEPIRVREIKNLTTVSKNLDHLTELKELK